MKISLRSILIILTAGIVAGAGVFWLGLINIGASTGHWAITDWVLHTAMRRSVQFRADATPPEDFPSAAMIRRGAGHYEIGCAPCHGSPAAPRGAVVREMTPEPPDLSGRIDLWSPADLFWIVKHGVKLTGMPAWPARSRDDEVWSMVAFLTEMPQMNQEEYRVLAYGDGPMTVARQREFLAETAPALIDCARCHGMDGSGDVNGAFPRLDIQDAAYLADSLDAYASGRRFSGIMQEAVAGLDEKTRNELAKYYAGTSSNAESESPKDISSDLLQRGGTIAMHGIPEDNIAACAGCHDQPGTAARPGFPRLSGQYRAYLETQLHLFAADIERGGGAFAHLMREATHALEGEDIKAVAAWYASRSTPSE